MFVFTIISMIATMASAAASAKAQYEQGKQQQKNMEYNAEIAEMDAIEEEQARATEAVEERKVSKRFLARMEAKYAKSGILMAGTPEAFMLEQAEVDEFNILSKDRASNIRATNFRTQAELNRFQGKDAYRAGKTGALTSLLTGTASAAGTAAKYDLDVGGKNPKVDPALRKSPMFAMSAKAPKMDTLASGGIGYNSILGN